MTDTAPDYAGLIERLEGRCRDGVAWRIEAAAAIRTLLERNKELERERDRAMRDLENLIKRLTPKPIRYAPKDPTQVIIGVERPPQEDQTFFYELIWCEDRKQFVGPYTRALNGATHFLDPANMIGIVWPREKARAARALKENGNGE